MPASRRCGRWASAPSSPATTRAGTSACWPAAGAASRWPPCVIAVMYLGLVFCIAEMGAALPHTGGAYSFARASMGPWGGFITGLCENVEYVLTPAVVVSFLATYLAAVFDTPTAWLPAYWVAGYAVFVGLNVWGVELSFRVTVIVTLAALACLAVFWIVRAARGRVQALCAQHRRRPRRRRHRAAPGQRAAAAVRPQGRLRRPALRGLAVPRHRAAAAGGRGIHRPQPRHAARHHRRPCSPSWSPPA